MLPNLDILCVEILQFTRKAVIARHKFRSYLGCRRNVPQVTDQLVHLLDPVLDVPASRNESLYMITSQGGDLQVGCRNVMLPCRLSALDDGILHFCGVGEL